MKIITSFFCSVFPLNGAFIFLLLRIGFPTDYLTVFKALGLAFILLILPVFLSDRLRTEQKKTWYLDSSFLLLILIILVAFTGFSLQRFSFDYAVLLTGFGYLLFLWLLIELFREVSGRRIAVISLASIVLSTFMISLVYGIHIKPLFYEGLISGSFPFSVDPLYHMANAQIFNNYGILSNGLDGVSYIPYHYGSHVLYAGIANFLKISIFDAYILLPVIITAPIFLYTFLLLVFQIRKFDNISSNVGFVFIAILLTAFIGFIRNHNYGLFGDIPNYAGMLLGSPILLVSDSYTVSLIFLNILSIISIAFYSNYRKGSEGKASKVIFLWLIVPVVFFCLGYSKISTLILIYILGGYLLLRLRLFYDKYFIVSFLLITICSVIVYYFIRDTKFGDGNLNLFYHFKESRQSIHLFLVFNYAWCWVLLTLFLLNGRIKSRREILSGHKFLPVEIILVLFSASMIPLLFVEIRSGNIYYFTEIASWLSVIMVLAYLPSFTFVKLTFLKRRLIVSRILLFLVSAYLVNVFYKNTQVYINWLLKGNYAARYYFLKGPVGLLTPEEFKISRFVKLDKESFTSIVEPFRSPHFDSGRITPVIGFFNAISKFNELPLAERKESVLYINFSELSFNLPIRCYEKPFLIPALSGIALINGGITSKCLEDHPWFRGYGYDYYRRREDGDFDLAFIKSATVEKGFKWLYYYDSSSSAFIKVNCRSDD